MSAKTRRTTKPAEFVLQVIKRTMSKENLSTDRVFFDAEATEALYSHDALCIVSADSLGSSMKYSVFLRVR